MFKNLLDFGYQRNLIGAFGFYIAYNVFFLASVLLAVLFSVLLRASPDASHKLGSEVGIIVAVIGPLTLSLLILAKKNLLFHFGYILLVLLGAALSIVGGGSLGMIPASLLTMLPSRAVTKSA